jgi:hypothetical protein
MKHGYMFKNIACPYTWAIFYVYPAYVGRDVACDAMDWHGCNGEREGGREITANFLWMPSSLLTSLEEIEFLIRESYCNLSLIKIKYDINKRENKRKLQYQHDPVTKYIEKMHNQHYVIIKSYKRFQDF